MNSVAVLVIAVGAGSKAPDLFPIGVMSKHDAMTRAAAQLAATCPGCPKQLYEANLVRCPDTPETMFECGGRTGWFWAVAYTYGTIMVNARSGNADMVSIGIGGT